MAGLANWEGCRWDGHGAFYESWFQRANHPSRPLAFWVRHTIFCPAGRPEAAQGEIWSIWFDGENGRVTAGKTEIAGSTCSFDPHRLDVQMPGARLLPGELEGGTEVMAWKLNWSSGGPPSLLLPESLNAGGFPKAKALCVVPNAHFNGSVTVKGESHAIQDWPGSHNHNWGSQHTDRYAWAQVCGFDGAPDVFLECATAQIKVGPLMTPKLTIAVLVVEGRRYELNSIPRGLLATASVEGFRWQFSNSAAGVEIGVTIDAPASHFVGLRYRNPPGGAKACLNSKIARCTLSLREGGLTRTFTSANRAAFEILCEESDPRVVAVGGLWAQPRASQA